MYMYNYNLVLEQKSIFKSTPLSKREAFIWLIQNSSQGEISCSLRYLGNVWQWNFLSVKRFLEKLESELLIEIYSTSKHTKVKICNYESLILPIKAFDTDLDTQNAQNSNDQTLEKQSPVDSRQTNLQQSLKHTLQQNQIKDLNKLECCNSNCNSKMQENTHLEQDSETELEQNETQEEKKKRTKKRKEEEFIKEKNIPFGDRKKEMLDQDFVCSSVTKVQIPFELVEASDLTNWVDEVLKAEVNLALELDKFKNYWRASRKKPPLDGIAAFKNWLYKGLQFKNQFQETKHDKPNYYKSEKPSNFQRFLAAGARVVAKYEGN